MEMAISVDSLLRLPTGAAYHKRSGQARAEVTKHGDTIYVTGTCDSLQRQVDQYKALYHTARDALELYHDSVQAEKQESTPQGRVFLAGLVIGLVAGVAICIYVKSS